MNNTIRFNETTYDFKYRLGIDSNNDAYEVFDIYIDGKKSIYYLEEGYTNFESEENKIYILFRDDLGTGVSIKKPTSIIDLAKVITKIEIYENLNK